VEAFVEHPPAQQMQKLYFEDDGVTPTLCACCAEQVSIKALLRLFSGSIKALLRLY
jgi:pyruvate/2-oxoacid:ferredoxin oxidoreductase beta subunit